MLKIFFAVVSICFLFSSCTYVSVEPRKDLVVSDSVISYSKTIEPLVKTQCSGAVGCHEGGSSDGDFTNYKGLGEKAADASLLKRVVTLRDMPQLGSGFDLSDRERGYFAAWIKQGFPNN